MMGRDDVVIDFGNQIVSERSDRLEELSVRLAGRNAVIKITGSSGLKSYMINISSDYSVIYSIGLIVPTRADQFDIQKIDKFFSSDQLSLKISKFPETLLFDEKEKLLFQEAYNSAIMFINGDIDIKIFFDD